MRIRTYAFALLVAIALGPLLTLGFLTSRRAERTAKTEVQTSAQRLSQVIGERIGAYLSAERRLLVSVGSAGLQMKAAADATALLRAHELDHPHMRSLSLHDSRGRLVAGHADSARHAIAKRVLASRTSLPMKVTRANGTAGAGFSHTSLWAEPVTLVGRTAGVILAEVDLVGVWPPVNEVKLGQTGFVRLLAEDGTLLAHGNPEERRFVFDRDQSAGSVVTRVDEHGQNRQGERIVSAAAPVPGTGWHVVVEQSTREALLGAALMKRDLAILGGAVVVVVLLLGFVLGRVLVRELERLQAHARELAGGNLDARVTSSARIHELAALTASLNDMAASLDALQRDARNRERMTTFARVAAGLAHDLRQPIETVRAVCAQLSLEPDDPETRARFENITARDLPRLGDYVGDLLRMARGDELALRVETVDPALVVARVVDDLSGSPKWEGVSFIAAGKASAARMDPRLIYRAVVNLASNGADACVQHADQGEVRIEVADAADGDAVEIRVCDTGVGIPPERIATVLDGDFETTKRSTGIGLGLGIVRHVALAHGGQLSATSTPGEGSQFSLVIPHHTAAPDAPAMSPSPSSVPTATPTQRT